MLVDDGSFQTLIQPCCFDSNASCLGLGSAAAGNLTGQRQRERSRAIGSGPTARVLLFDPLYQGLVIVLPAATHGIAPPSAGATVGRPTTRIARASRQSLRKRRQLQNDPA